MKDKIDKLLKSSNRDDFLLALHILKNCSEEDIKAILPHNNDYPGSTRYPNQFDQTLIPTGEIYILAGCDSIVWINNRDEWKNWANLKDITAETL